MQSCSTCKQGPTRTPARWCSVVVPYGAYGFGLKYRNWGGTLRDLVELDKTAPLVTLEWRHACPARTFDVSAEGFAAMGTRAATAFSVSRDTLTIVLDVAVEPAPDAVIHPIATVPIAVLARWRGDVTLHAGSFEADGVAWALLGERRTGKSTTLGVLCQRGHGVVADDLLVVQDGLVWAGPRCVDLRHDAAERLGPVRDLGVIGPRRRYRLSSPPTPARLPLGGFFVLEWHDRLTVEIERLPLRERVPLLFALEYAGIVGAADPTAILDLASRPMWRLKRPRHWSATEEAVERMLDVAMSMHGLPSMHTGAA
jgi:hypothetical protein